MNKMKEVAALLGVRLGEQFTVRTAECIPITATILADGFNLKWDGKWIQSDIWLVRILTGKAEIVKEKKTC